MDESLIIDTAVVLLVAGYETTGTTTRFMFRLFSINQEVQEMLHEEINNSYKTEASKKVIQHHAATGIFGHGDTRDACLHQLELAS